MLARVLKWRVKCLANNGLKPITLEERRTEPIRGSRSLHAKCCHVQTVGNRGDGNLRLS